MRTEAEIRRAVAALGVALMRFEFFAHDGDRLQIYSSFAALSWAIGHDFEPFTEMVERVEARLREIGLPIPQLRKEQAHGNNRDRPSHSPTTKGASSWQQLKIRRP